MPATQTDMIEGLTTSVAVKAPCIVATTGAITLSGAQTIDGVAVAETTPPTRVLVPYQADTTQNGIYDVKNAAWVRSLDFNGPRDAVFGTLVYVVGGLTNGAIVFQATCTDSPVIFGTSRITFAPSPTTATGPLTFMVATQVAGVKVPDANSIIETVGYASISDGGNARWSRVTNPTVLAALAANAWHFAYLKDAAGKYFELLPDNRGINCNALGAVNDGRVVTGDVYSGTDARAVVQHAIDYALYFTKCPVYIREGNYRLSGPLEGGYGIAAAGFPTYTKLVFQGAGNKHTADLNYAGTMFLCDYVTDYGINVQGSTSSVIEDMTFRGKNFIWQLQTAQLFDEKPQLIDLDPRVMANCINPAILSANPNANSRYTPFVAVTVDARCGAQPATHYSDVVYPAFLGTVAQYGKIVASSKLVLSRVEAWGFVGFLAVQPCDFDGQGEFPSLQDCRGGCMAFLFSAGNSQCRNVGVHNSDFFNFHTGFVNTMHGRQIGQFQGVSNNCTYFRCYQWLDVPLMVWAGPLVMLNCYGENVNRIGRVGSNSSAETSLIFDGCTINFTQQKSDGVAGTKQQIGTPGYVIETVGASIIEMNGTVLGDVPSVLAFGGDLKNYRLKGVKVRLRGDAQRTTLAYKLFHNATAGGMILIPSGDGTNAFPDSFSAQPQYRYNVVTGDAVLNETVTDHSGSERARNICIYSRYSYPNGAAQKIAANVPMMSQFDPSSGGGIVDTFVVTGRTATITLLAGQWAAWQREVRGLSNGDAMVHIATGATFVIRSRTGDVYTADLQNFFVWDGAAYQLAAATDFKATGNFWLINSRTFRPKYMLKGDISTTANTTKITNAGDDTQQAWVSDEIKLGDHFYSDPRIDNWRGITQGAVSATDGTGTITFAAGANTKDQVGREFTHVFMVAPANS